MRVLGACSLGGAGHLNPLLPLLTAARRRGAETLVVGPPSLAETVQMAGFTFVSGEELPESKVAPITERLPLAPPEEASVLGNRELFGRLAASAMLPTMEKACADWSPDVVLRDPCEYASVVVASRLGIRSAQVAISLAEAEAGSIAAAAPALEEHQAGLVEEVRAVPYLTRLPSSLDPSPFPTTLRFRESAGPAASGSVVWQRGDDMPRVYVSFGTVVGRMTMAGDLYQAALKAVRDLDVDVLLTVGRRFDPSLIEPIPGNVRVEQWVDQAAVFEDADLVVCHGGSGTAFGALAAGVPVVIVPLFADQFENARRIAGAGAGLVVHRDAKDEAAPVLDDAAVEAIAEAISTVLDTPSYRDAARRIAQEMGRAPDVDEVLDRLLSGDVDVKP